MPTRVTAPEIRARKGSGEPVVCVTAYDAAFARMADDAGVDVVLVGDSLGNVVQGQSTTLGVTLEAMVHHTAAARAGVRRALLVADLPFGTYGHSVERAADAAVALVRAGADAVKLEGAHPEEIRAMHRMGIPVMGHVGFTPQSVLKFGGHRAQGRGEAAKEVVSHARQVEEAGAFAMVVELTPPEVARQVTEAVGVPTIGIGAGPYVDGQVQVLHDVLGLEERTFRHAYRARELGETVRAALEEYASAVREGRFPTEEHAPQ